MSWCDEQDVVENVVTDFWYCKNSKFKKKSFMAPLRQLQPVRERDEGVANGLGVYIYRVCILRNTTKFDDMLQNLNIFPRFLKF